MKSKLFMIITVMIPFFFLTVPLQVVDSQIVNKKPPTVKKTPPIVPTKRIIFEGRSIVPGGATDTPLTSELSRTPLTIEEKKAMLLDAISISGVKAVASEVTVSTYANLNARTPFVENRAYLYLWEASVVDPKLIHMKISESGFFNLMLKPDRINGIYLIDCEVTVVTNTNEQNPHFSIWGPDGNTTHVTISGSGHLQMFLISKNLEWQGISVRRYKAYAFKGCEIISAGVVE